MALATLATIEKKDLIYLPLWLTRLNRDLGFKPVFKAGGDTNCIS